MNAALAGALGLRDGDSVRIAQGGSAVLTVAVDDSLAYIADRGRGQIIRYKRRP